MPAEQDQHPEVGHFEFEIFGSARRGRPCSSRFRLRCDAIGLHDNEILLLSVIGPETSTKALTAGLRASGQEQRRIAYTAHVGGINATLLGRSPAGYRIYRTKLDYGLWHVLCLAKREDFVPVLTEETVWQLLSHAPFTTPLLREWVPWLFRELHEREHIVPLTQSGCWAGLLLADSNILDSLVQEGLQKDHLGIQEQTIGSLNPQEMTQGEEIQDLDQYMLTYGSLLGKQAERSLEPLHVPGRDCLPSLDLLREPFAAQTHVIEAVRKSLKRQKSILLVGEMGTGKTIMALGAIHGHAAGRPYRALVFCPGQLVNKWEREIHQTIPEAQIIQIDSWKNLLHLDKTRKPTGPEWFIIARDRAKLGAKWQPAFLRRNHADDGFLRCPQCGRRLVDDKREPLTVGKPGQNGQPGTGLWKRRTKCEWVLTNDFTQNDSELQNGDQLVEGCGSPLWQMNSEINRYEPAVYIKRHLKNYFKYLVLDEIHEEKGAATAQGHAAGALAAACQKVIALTGTLIGGYAEHLRPLLFRLAPGSLVQEGLGWANSTAFNERYGRIETRITERTGNRGDEDNRMSRGSKSTVKYIRPGIMPVLFGKHLIDKTVFLGLSEVADNLPTLEEECLPISMDEELSTAYKQQVEEPLVEAIKEMMRRRDRRLLGAMLQTLLAYPDYPFGWEPVGYYHQGEFVTVTVPPDLAENVIYPKEQALIDLVRSEKTQHRRVWVYVQYTDKRDVQSRLEQILQQQGFRVGVLRASVPLARREEWIDKNAPRLDVVISHPRLVETGLDLFDKLGRYNFPTITFFQTSYNLFTLRQASRRSWRIGQKQPCRIVYFYYQDTMQERALSLMGRKLTASQAIEGVFSTEGLVAMAGEDANMEIALARSLVEKLDEGDARRMWSKVIHQQPVGENEHPQDPTEESITTSQRLWLITRDLTREPVVLRKPPRPRTKANYRPGEKLLF